MFYPSPKTMTARALFYGFSTASHSTTSVACHAMIKSIVLRCMGCWLYDGCCPMRVDHDCPLKSCLYDRFCNYSPPAAHRHQQLTLFMDLRWSHHITRPLAISRGWNGSITIPHIVVYYVVCTACLFLVGITQIVSYLVASKMFEWALIRSFAYSGQCFGILLSICLPTDHISFAILHIYHVIINSK